MFCPKCGKKLTVGGAKFCPICGMSFTEDVDAPVEQEGNVNQSTDDKLVFRKTKMMGMVTYSTVDTEITIDNQIVHFDQTINKILRSIKKVEETFLLSEISEIGIKTKMDFWDTLFGVIFALLGIFITPANFIMAAVCLYCGYGKVIQICTVNGKKYIIPSALKTDDVQKLLDLVNGENRLLNN